MWKCDKHFVSFFLTLILLQWHALSKEEQQKYYEMARKEREKHMVLYPGWSARDNYGKRKKAKEQFYLSLYYVEYDWKELAYKTDQTGESNHGPNGGR